MSLAFSTKRKLFRKQKYKLFRKQKRTLFINQENLFNAMMQSPFSVDTPVSRPKSNDLPYFQQNAVFSMKRRVFIETNSVLNVVASSLASMPIYGSGASIPAFNMPRTDLFSH